MYVCMFVCMYVCTYVCVCMYVCCCCTKKGLINAHDLCSLRVDRAGVEVVHGDVGLRADGVRHRSSVLRELPTAQRPHVLDALDSMTGEVRGEPLQR